MERLGNVCSCGNQVSLPCRRLFVNQIVTDPLMIVEGAGGRSAVTLDGRTELTRERVLHAIYTSKGNAWQRVACGEAKPRCRVPFRGSF